MPEYERTIRWDDEELAIEWPLVNGEHPLLAKKDQLEKRFRDRQFSDKSQQEPDKLTPC